MGPEDALVVLQEGVDLALVPGVVATGEHIAAVVQELLCDVTGQPEASGRVLGVRHDEVDVVLGNEPIEQVSHRSAAGTGEHVADEEDLEGHRA